VLFNAFIFLKKIFVSFIILAVLRRGERVKKGLYRMRLRTRLGGVREGMV